MSKDILRNKILKIRKKKYQQKEINYKFLKKILRINNISSKSIIGCYYPINSEIDCLHVIEKLHRDKFIIALPKIKANNKMDFLKWSKKQILEIGKMGIPVPKNIRKVVPDVILVPLVAYDNNNNRLGYGGGYYDRYIKKIKKTKKILLIGLAFSFQNINNFNTNRFDQKLDLIITEK